MQKKVSKGKQNIKKMWIFAFQGGIESNGIERSGTCNPSKRSTITKFATLPT
jgi:hypothetical protein